MDQTCCVCAIGAFFPLGRRHRSSTSLTTEDRILFVGRLFSQGWRRNLPVCRPPFPPMVIGEARLLANLPKQHSFSLASYTGFTQRSADRDFGVLGPKLLKAYEGRRIANVAECVDSRMTGVGGVVQVSDDLQEDWHRAAISDASKRPGNGGSPARGEVVVNEKDTGAEWVWDGLKRPREDSS